MGRYNFKIKLLSDTIIGSAEGFSSTTDNDVIFDEVGLPYIPARRIKGILRDSAEELQEMFQQSGIDWDFNIEEIFGAIGTTNSPTRFHLSNFFLPEYKETKEYLKKCIEKKQFGLSPNSIINFFCSLRNQTSIDKEKGTAKKHSLRTSRVVNKGYEFWGEANFDDKHKEIMGLICANTRRMGTKRNRGFGRISIQLFNTDKTKEIKEESFESLEVKL